MATSAEETARIAALAHLRLSGEELEAMTSDLIRILDYVEQLAELDLEEMADVGGVVDWPAPERRSGLPPDALTRGPGAQAPDWREGFFVVPRVPALEGGGGEGVSDGDPGSSEGRGS